MKQESIAQVLQASSKGFVVAPAGYGKTFLIAEAVANYGGRLELILTHTHAGVDSLRKKILSFKPSPKNFHVETIDSFILRFVLNYPITSKWGGDIENIDWLIVRQCGLQLVKKNFIKMIIKNSYSGIYVDEYQDCCIEQHEIVHELSRVLPIRILGDPLQGIFDFGNNKIVDWQNDVESKFSKVGTLSTPWRWQNANNVALGSWLGLIRTKIEKRERIELTALPACVKHIKSSSEAQIITACYSVLSNVANDETVVIIGKADRVQSTHEIASKLKGCYGVIEPIDSKDLKKVIGALDNISKFKQGMAALTFGISCFSGINKTLLKNELVALSKDILPKKRDSLSISQPLNVFLNEQNLKNLLVLLESLKGIKNSHLFRKELYWETIKIVREAARTGGALKEALIRVRENSRRFGRKMSKRIIGRTLLIKGLEFDHAVVINADLFDRKNLYVALTRASKTLTIISNSDDFIPQ